MTGGKEEDEGGDREKEGRGCREEETEGGRDCKTRICSQSQRFFKGEMSLLLVVFCFYTSLVLYTQTMTNSIFDSYIQLQNKNAYEVLSLIPRRKELPFMRFFILAQVRDTRSTSTRHVAHTDVYKTRLTLKHFIKYTFIFIIE